MSSQWIKITLFSIFAILTPIKELLIIVSLLILADTITGILAAYHRGEEINSKGFKKTIIKLFLYNLVVILAFLIEKYILLDFIPFVKIGVAVIALTEFKSVVENFEAVTGIKLLQIKKIIEDQTKQPQQNQNEGGK